MTAGLRLRKTRAVATDFASRAAHLPVPGDGGIGTLNVTFNVSSFGSGCELVV